MFYSFTESAQGELLWLAIVRRAACVNFSSPEDNVLKVSFCDGPLSVFYRPSLCPCVNKFFKQLLLWNSSLDFDQISQEWSQGGPLPKLFKPFQLVSLVGHGVKHTFSNCNFQKSACLKLKDLELSFLAHLKTMSSRWAFVMGHCPSPIVCPPVSASTISLNNFSSESDH